jgi:alkylation response protein AidB-like acyl-CoA dehydrogenase
MDFGLSPGAEEVCARMWGFMREEVFPAEKEYEQWRAGHDPHAHPPVLERLKASAKKRDLWNLFLPEISGLSNLDYAAVAEISGWSPVIAPEAINCQAPDTGNMETLHLFATPEQKQQWLEPLLSGEIRSAFAMTEPDVASSDATNITTRMVGDGDDYVINGQCRCLSAANYRGMECEHLGGHPAGRAADLACCAEGVLRGRALEAPVGFPQAPDAVAGLAADLRGHRRHELLDLH